MSAAELAEMPQPLVRPAVALDLAALDELELLLGGLYCPADGYCLPSQTPAGWPAAFSIEVPLSLAQEALRHGALDLTDADGTPIASLEVNGSAPAGPGSQFLSGPVSARQPAEHPPARNLRLTRPAVHDAAAPVVIAAFRAEPSAADMAAAVCAAAGAQLLLVAVVPTQQPGARAPSALLTSLQRCAAAVPGAWVGLFVEPSRRGATPGERRALTRHALGRLGARAVLEFEPAAAEPGSGPGAEPVRGGYETRRGAVIFFTGLSGSGKSTVARALAEHLQDTDDRPVTLLDGDEVRRLLSSELGFSVADRDLNVRRIAWVAAAVARCGGVAICAPIAPSESTRATARRMVGDAGTFVLVHVSTSLEVCERRDRKGLYAKARAGLLRDFTGIDATYEVPPHPDLVVDTAVTPVEGAVRMIVDLVQRRTP